MAALITLAEMRKHVETDLEDTAMQRLIDDADATIVKQFGEHTSQVDDGLTGERRLFPSRPIDADLIVTETIIDGSGFEQDTVLSATDYKILNGGRVLKRQIEGDNPRQFWGQRVKLSYTPESDIVRRARVTVDLVKLAVANSGTRREEVGDFETWSLDYEKERTSILSRLHTSAGAGGLMA